MWSEIRRVWLVPRPRWLFTDDGISIRSLPPPLHSGTFSGPSVPRPVPPDVPATPHTHAGSCQVFAWRGATRHLKAQSHENLRSPATTSVVRLGPVVGNRRYFLRFQPSSPIVRPVVPPVEDLLPTDSTTNRATIARSPKTT